MRILLDTQILLWLLITPERVSPSVIAEVENTENDVLFSAVSIWEIAIKSALGRDRLPADAEETLAHAVMTGFRELPVTGALARHVANLPLHHRDPFDRLLVAQAICEPAILYTVDAQLRAYSELVRVV
jgi:PIN domain nuclease of toxin-antitoxin system